MSEHLADAAIDALNATELRDAVARAQGWTNRGAYWYAPGEHDQAFKAWTRHPFHAIDTNTGAALGLLSSLECADIDIAFRRDGTVTIIKHSGTYASGFVILASGPKEDIARLCCVAFLKCC